jgi:hypothetical protein
VAFLVGTSGEEQRRLRSVVRAAQAEDERPQAVDLDGGPCELRSGPSGRRRAGAALPSPRSGKRPFANASVPLVYRNVRDRRSAGPGETFQMASSLGRRTSGRDRHRRVAKGPREHLPGKSDRGGTRKASIPRQFLGMCSALTSKQACSRVAPCRRDRADLAGGLATATRRRRCYTVPQSE